MSAGQSAFATALLDPARAVPEGLLAPDGAPAGRRFSVYRNNVAVSLTEALTTAFPVLAKLLGEANFRGLAGLFLRAHPPSSPVLMFYGAEMPGFLAALPQLAHLPYLPDIARLELCLRESYHAADADTLGPEAFTALSPDRLLSARPRLHPAVRVVASPWPIHGIWARNMVPGAPKPAPGAETVLITRPGFDPVQTLLPDGGAALVRDLAEGAALGAAIEAGGDGFDPADTLARLITAGAFAALEETAP
ncbi:DNA-binding domain-containing protein [Palleronia sp. KMU-117]|uniref:HvfC/BufC N-terminal domain-containing protein n=1 Tax=Palleronia sp. KMU-117 TaxID=3434108 RepID=UPI003D7095EC